MTTHALFVTAAYGVTALGIGGLLAWTLIDQQAQKRMLAKLETSGVRRRSAGKDGGGA